MTAEPIALQLRDHQRELADWEYAGLVRELHRWVALFNREFSLNLPSYPVVRFAPLRNAYATYAWFCTELGTRDNITFNTLELDRDPALILRTLCHELVHLWQHYHGSPGRGTYHNAEFRDKALSCGLIVDRRGCTSGHTAVFTSVLAKHGVHLAPLTPESMETPVYGAGKREQKMRKWRCGCTSVRCAVQLRALCTACGLAFQRS